MTGSPADDARRAALVPLPADATASTAFVLIVDECLDHWRTNVPRVLDHRDIEALHQTRVGVRRLRSAYSLFRRLLRREPEFLATAAELRMRAVPLGRARDLDVVLAGSTAAGLSPLQQAELRDLRERAYDEVAAVLTGPRWAALVDRVDAFERAAPWSLAQDPPARVVASTALERRWTRVIRRGARLRDLSPAGRHAIRIEAKKLRYGAQFFSTLYAGADGADPLELAEAVAALQDALGELNDVATARAILAEVGADVPPVSEPPLLDAAVVAWADVAVLAPFWR